ncbi:hypothetical protein D9M68_533240 [compost metagenome]
MLVISQRGLLHMISVSQLLLHSVGYMIYRPSLEREMLGDWCRIILVVIHGIKILIQF